jgi:hypothetical protein
MTASEPFGQEHLHGLSEKLFPFMTEHLLSLGVQQQNAARSINLNDSIRRSLQQPAVPIIQGNIK